MSNLIYKKMSQVMADIGSISKDNTNTMQGFKFRGIDQFVNALYPALTKHGVFMAPECVSESHELREVTRSNGKAGLDKHVALQMKYNFYAEDGSHVTIGPIPAEGLDSGDKATNKALSAALKYALIQTFSVPTVDMVDGDLDSPEIKGTVQSKVAAALQKTNGNIQASGATADNAIISTTSLPLGSVQLTTATTNSSEIPNSSTVTNSPVIPDSSKTSAKRTSSFKKPTQVAASSNGASNGAAKADKGWS